MIEEGLRTFILASSPISTLIAERCYGIKLPQKPTMPAIVITRVSGDDEYNSSGANDLAKGRFQFDCWADTLKGSRDLAQLLKTRLSGYRGSAGSESISGAFINNKQDFYDTETENHRRLTDFIVWYKE